jgi:hypothetical protein
VIILQTNPKIIIMRKIIIAFALLTLFSCTKLDIQDIQAVQNAKGSPGSLFLSETYIDGVLTKKNIYENGKALKTVFYHSYGNSELVYEYDAANRKVVFNEPGVIRTFFYDNENRPIRQNFYDAIIIDYFYEKDMMTRLLWTAWAGDKPHSISDMQYIYDGKWLTQINTKSTSYLESGTYENTSTSNMKWSNPYTYSTYEGNTVSSISKYSNTIKTPDYNFNITPTGFNLSQNIPKSDLISQSGIVFGNPSSGMLLLETINPSNGNRTYLENIVVNTDNQPLSYDAVSESGSNVTSRRKHEYKYVRLNVN